MAPKRILVLFVLAVLAFGLCACNKTEEITAGGYPASQSKSETSKTAAQSTSASQSQAKQSSSTGSQSHNHEFTEKVIEPTCLEGGYTEKVCSCGHSEKYNETEKTSHSFGGWQVVIEPTRKTRGYRERFCTVCNFKEHEDLEKLPASSVSSSRAEEALKPESSSAADVPQIEAASWNEEVLRLVNIERESNGLPPLSYAWQVQTAADIRAQEITQVFDHTRPNGTLWHTVLNETGVSCSIYGENLAMGQTTPAMAVQAWMNSPGHRANILDSDYTQLAVGINGNCWVQLFTN